MQLTYEYQKSDFRPLLRHNGYRRLIAWIVAILAAVFAPSLLVLWAAGLGQLAVGGLVAFGCMAASLQWMVRRTTRRSFLERAASHQLTLEDGLLEHESKGRWYRSNGRWVTAVEERGAYILIRRRTQTALIPKRSLPDPEQQRQLLQELRAAADRQAPPPPLRQVEGERLAEVEFQYGPRQLKQLAQQRFVPREERGSALWLMLLAIALAWVLLPGMIVRDSQASTPLPRAAALVLALALPVPAWMATAPLRRRLNQLPDEVQLPQRVALWTSGLEHAGEHFQSFLRWEHVTRVLDGRDYIVFYGDTGGWSAVPRAAFGDEQQAQQFCDEALRRVRLHHEQQAEEAELAEPLPPRVETGNPYQPPGGNG